MEETGKILRIEKISLNDGQGMRTVIFFKGCPLRCAWCSTPESQCMNEEVCYQSQRCTGCGRCITACPQNALSVDEETGRIIRNRVLCTNCAACVKVCPAKAQGVYGKQMTLAQVMKQIYRDEVFYFHSGGGVTLSGGDVLLQAEFARKILQACKESGIHTAAELDLFGPYEKIQMLLPFLDVLYVDVKMMDPESHKKWTGQDNRGILENLRRVSEACGKDALHVRVPLVPGVNDSRGNLLATAEFCKSLPHCAELEFLPYHRLGQAAYTYLDRESLFRHMLSMTPEEAAEKIACLETCVLPFPVRVAGRQVFPAAEARR